MFTSSKNTVIYTYLNHIELLKIYWFIMDLLFRLLHWNIRTVMEKKICYARSDITEEMVKLHICIHT